MRAPNCGLLHCPWLKVGESGLAVGIDHIDQLVNDSIANVRKDPNLGGLLDRGQLKLVVGDGRQGHPPSAPFDAIHVGAAAPQIPQAVSAPHRLSTPPAKHLISFAYILTYKEHVSVHESFREVTSSQKGAVHSLLSTGALFS